LVSNFGEVRNLIRVYKIDMTVVQLYVQALDLLVGIRAFVLMYFN